MYNVLNFVRAIVEALMLTNTFDRVELNNLLENVRRELSDLHERYSEPAPEGAEATRELMLEAVELYDKGLCEILTFLEDNDPSHLPNAVWLAEEAADVVLTVEDVVNTNKRLLADMVSV